MTFFKRNENGRLAMSSLDLQILIGEMFYVAKDEDEIDWIRENLEAVVDMCEEERLEELEEF